MNLLLETTSKNELIVNSFINQLPNNNSNLI